MSGRTRSTPPGAAPRRGRRALLTGVGASLALGALAGDGEGAGHLVPPEGAATLADLAALTFTDQGPQIAAMVDACAPSTDRAYAQFDTLRAAGGLLRADDGQMADLVHQVGFAAIRESVEQFQELQDHYRALIAVLEAAVIRAVAGVARNTLRPGGWA